jgi:hypothetical protein
LETTACAVPGADAPPAGLSEPIGVAGEAIGSWVNEGGATPVTGRAGLSELIGVAGEAIGSWVNEGGAAPVIGRVGLDVLTGGAVLSFTGGRLN